MSSPVGVRNVSQVFGPVPGECMKPLCLPVVEGYLHFPNVNQCWEQTDELQEDVLQVHL